MKIPKLKLGKKNSISGDFTVIFLVTALVMFGIVMVFSASYYNAISSTGSPYGYLKKHVIFAVMGFGLMYFCSVVDYHIFKKVAFLIMAISIILLLALFTPLGTTTNGATRWILIGPMTLMPGEIAKISCIIFVSSFLSTDSGKILSFRRGIFPLLVLTAVVAGLIIKQPNLSTAIAVCGIILGIMFIAGLEWKWIVVAVASAGAGVVALITIVGGYWKNRLVSFTDPFEDALGDGFQVVQSLLALGTGGIKGLGLGKSIQKNLYLPEPQNDFILAIIGEELGFIGIAVLMTVYVVLIWKCFIISMNAPDRFGMLLSGGVAVMLGIQVVINVAVVTSSMPPTGITLPFVSYGGNALWIFMCAAGIVINISKQGKKKTLINQTSDMKRG